MDNNVLSAYALMYGGQSQPPLVFVVQCQMPAAVRGDLLKQTYLVLAVFVQKALLATVYGLHVLLETLALNDGSSPLRGCSQSAGNRQFHYF